MDDSEDLIARLNALGSEAVGTERLSGTGRPWRAGPGDGRGGIRSRRLTIVAAFVIGLFAGTSGLAAAGALPGGAQEVAHTAFGAVGVKVPHGERYQGPECGGAVKNHGQYVRSQPKEKRAEAAASRCGKPLQAGTGDEGPAGAQGNDKAGCQGPPPWAGKGKPDAAAKAARRQACGEGRDDADDEDESPAPATGVQPAAPQTPETSTDPSTVTSPTTATTATTTTAPTTTAPTTTVTGSTGGTGSGDGGSGTTGTSGTSTTTTQPAGTTVPGTGADGNGPPSTPVDPPAAGERS